MGCHGDGDKSERSGDAFPHRLIVCATGRGHVRRCRFPRPATLSARIPRLLGQSIAFAPRRVNFSEADLSTTSITWHAPSSRDHRSTLRQVGREGTAEFCRWRFSTREASHSQ
jgi:hypothetical protein